MLRWTLISDNDSIGPFLTEDGARWHLLANPTLSVTYEVVPMFEPNTEGNPFESD
jgi:hypothetical protein